MFDYYLAQIHLDFFVVRISRFLALAAVLWMLSATARLPFLSSYDVRTKVYQTNG